MAKRMDLPFSDLMKRLSEDAHSATWYIGYLKAIFDNEAVPQKRGGSYCGRALVTAQDGVTRALALYCTRIWEDKVGLASLPRAALLLPSAKDLREKHLARIFEQSAEFWKERWLNKIETRRSDYLDQFHATSKNIVHDQLKMLRNESFAHNFAESRERSKLEKAGAAVSPTGTALVDIATKSVALVDGLIQLWDGIGNQPNLERIGYTERQCREFWRVLPILKDVERPV